MEDEGAEYRQMNGVGETEHIAGLDRRDRKGKGLGSSKQVYRATLLQASFVGCITLRAPLSGTFLQALPYLVTPLKAGALFISA